MARSAAQGLTSWAHTVCFNRAAQIQPDVPVFSAAGDMFLGQELIARAPHADIILPAKARTLCIMEMQIMDGAPTPRYYLAIQDITSRIPVPDSH